MQRSSIHITTLIILLSIITAIIQFGSYYFLGSTFWVYGASILVILLFTHILLERSLTYESCFNYTLLNLFICIIVLLLLYYGDKKTVVPYESITYERNLTIYLALDLVIPFLYCIFRNLRDRGPKFINFNIFFRNSSIILLLVYGYYLVQSLFITNSSTVLYFDDLKSINFIPFYTIATLIEDYINNIIPLEDIADYLFRAVILFIPYGFYMTLLFRKNSRLIRFFSLLLLPILTESLQRFLDISKGDIDDIVFAVIGGFLGALCYHLLNNLYCSVKDEHFLSKQSHYSYYHSSLHF